MHGVVWWRPASSNIIWYINQQVNIINLLHLRFSPPSEQTYSSPSSRDFTKTFKFDCSSALHNSSSEYWLNGSRFILRLPVRQTGNYIIKRVRAPATPRHVWICFQSDRTLSRGSKRSCCKSNKNICIPVGAVYFIPAHFGMWRNHNRVMDCRKKARVSTTRTND